MIAIPHYISSKDYLDIERHSPIRHEYRLGLVSVMVGATDNHDRLALNLLSLINQHLDDSDCRFHSGNVKISYQDDFYYYPDAFVICDPRNRNDRSIKRFPKLIVEILSPSTEAFDLSEKFEDYKELESIEEYVLIPQEHCSVECHRRSSQTNRGKPTVFEENDMVSLTSTNLEFSIGHTLLWPR